LELLIQKSLLPRCRSSPASPLPHFENINTTSPQFNLN
jgi:hypothetical protein